VLGKAPLTAGRWPTAGGLGPSAGKVWRVGIMGFNAKPQNIALVLEAFRDGLQQQGKL
jgi:alanine-glyoxylate transaminase / serine-glyoxylate transaminase / serine-pyruvate transaminase